MLKVHGSEDLASENLAAKRFADGIPQNEIILKKVKKDWSELPLSPY